MPELREKHRAEIEDLTTRLTFQNIEYHLCSARFDPPSEEDRPPKGQVAVDFHLEHRVEGDNLGIRVVVNVMTAQGPIDVAAVVEYTLSTGEMPPKPVLTSFGQEVGLVTLFPYIREAVDAMSAKVFRRPLVLPDVRVSMMSEFADE